MNVRRILPIAAFISLILSSSVAFAAETNCLVRDPSTIIKRGDTYWVYGTGRGTQMFSSKDRLNWTKRGEALPDTPQWLAVTVPGNRNEVWAPDIHLFNGIYYLYSSYSQWGTTKSGIGLATSKTLEPGSWQDKGLVITSAHGANYNTIDPCIFEDARGQPWLSFGSFFSGIKLIQIDPATGMQSKANPKIYNIATRQTPGNAIEASCVYYKSGWYYLFVNWDSCCVGNKSSYNIRVRRSKAVTGPYLDKSDKDMMQGGGSLFLAAVYDNGKGRLIDDEVGPGHAAILKDKDGYWLSTHYEWAQDKRGATTANVQRLEWDRDGWPRAILDPGPFSIVSMLPTHAALTVSLADTAARLAVQPRRSDAQEQKWTLTHTGEGFYTLTQNGKTALGANSKDELLLLPMGKSANRLWYLRQNEDGAYSLLPKSDMNSALTITDAGSLSIQKHAGTEGESWTFHR